MTPAETERFIHPGEWYFGTAHRRLRTLLGSCVAITVWHPGRQLGGLCHYLLPEPPPALVANPPDPRYGIHVLKMLHDAMQKQAPLQEFQLGCYGGSDMFAGKIRGKVGDLNIALARQWLQIHDFRLFHQDIGGLVSRSLVLDIVSGAVTVKRAEPGLQAGSYI